MLSCCEQGFDSAEHRLTCDCWFWNELPDAGDVFYLNWDEVLVGATAVVSTIGGFGSEEQMQRINGEANVVSVNAAKDFGKSPSNIRYHYVD